MGRNKIKIEKIKNDRIRQVTFYKRKKGLLKKAMELSLLCESKVFLCIVDKNDRKMIFSSESDINLFKEKYLNDHLNSQEIYTHNEYKNIFEEGYNCEFSAEMSGNEDEGNRSEKNEDDYDCKKRTTRTNNRKKDKIKNESEVERKESSHLSSYRDCSKNSEEDGITKLKQKLSLKIKIPGNNIQDKSKSIDSEPKDSSFQDSKPDQTKELDQASLLKIENFSNNQENFKDQSQITSGVSIMNLKPKLGLKVNIGGKKDLKEFKEFEQPQPKGTNTPGLGKSVDPTSSAKVFANFFNSNTGTPINAIPLSNSYVFCNENIFSGQKRFREEMGFSPDRSAGTVKGFTPLYNSISPGVPNMFIFNNPTFSPITPDVLMMKGAQQANFSQQSQGQTTNINNFNNTNNINFTTSLPQGEMHKSESLFDYSPQVKSSQNSSLVDEENFNIQNQSSQSEKNNLPNVNNISSVNNLNIDVPNLLLVSTPNSNLNPNLGFYKWVMQGSPQITSNVSLDPPRKRKDSKLKKTKYADEADESSESK